MGTFRPDSIPGNGIEKVDKGELPHGGVGKRATIALVLTDEVRKTIENSGDKSPKNKKK